MSAAFDRRNAIRAGVHLSVQVMETTTTSHATMASDIGELGLFIHELLPFEIGTPLLLSFDLPGLERTISCTGEVVHKRDHFLEGMPDRPIGNGVRFVDLARADRDQIARYVVECA